MNCKCLKKEMNEKEKELLDNTKKKLFLEFSNILLKHTLNDKIEKKKNFNKLQTNQLIWI